MIRRKISEAFTLRLFQKKFEALSNQSISLEYLHTSEVYGFFHQGELVAGFVIRATPGLWHLDLLEAADVDVSGIRVREDQFCELAGLWVAKKVASPGFRINFNLTCVADAIQTGKQLILGGSQVKGLAQNHQICLPYTLYQGVINGAGQQPWHIYYGTRWSCMKGVAMQFPGRMKEVFKSLPGDHHGKEVSDKSFGRWHKVTKRLIGRNRV